MARKAGRPRALIDWQQVGKLLEADCQIMGIAAIMGVSTDTLYTRCQTDNKMDFSAFSQQKKAKGDEQLRVKQYQTAMGGNVTMQIWLGKQRLTQSEKSEVKSDVTQRTTANLDVKFVDYRAIIPTEIET